MGTRFFKPYTPGTRGRMIGDFLEITEKIPLKSLSFFYHSSVGRNNRGVITSRNKGGGHKRLFRKIDFKRNILGVKAKVISIEYDPNRNSRISLLCYSNGLKKYILHPRDLLVKSYVISDFSAPVKIGNSLPLNKIPLGTNIHNIEFQVNF
jgi:large subunit ribosomal protein L2